MGPATFTYVAVPAEVALAIPAKVPFALDAFHVLAPAITLDAVPALLALLDLKLLHHLPLLLLIWVSLLVLLAGAVVVVGRGLAVEAPGLVALLTVDFDFARVGLLVVHPAPRSQTHQVVRLLQQVLDQLELLGGVQQPLQVGLGDFGLVAEETVDFELPRLHLLAQVVPQTGDVAHAPAL